MNSYQTTTAFNTSIANYYTKTQINNTLGSYVNTVSNTTDDSLPLISLTKVNNVLTFNYDNLASKFGGYYSTVEVDFKLGHKLDNFTIGVGFNYLSLTGGPPELIFGPIILGNPASRGLPVYDICYYKLSKYFSGQLLHKCSSRQSIERLYNNVYSQ